MPKLWILGALLLGLVLVSGCISAPSSGLSTATSGIDFEQEYEDTFHGITRRVVRLHDADLRVTCWAFESSFKGGISCLPDSQIAR